MSQADWEDDDIDTMDIIFIEHENKIDCFDASTIRRFLREGDSIVTEWRKVHNRNSASTDAQGRGWEPSLTKKFYLKMYLLDTYVTIDSIIMMLNSKSRHFKVKKLDKIRVGNLAGTFGVSQQHAQLPLEQIVELV